jgi:hypothetical protein
MLGKVNVADQRRSALMKERGFGISCLAAALAFSVGFSTPVTPAWAGVSLLGFQVGPDASPPGASGPSVALSTPTPVLVSLSGTTGGTNPLPSIPEAAEYDRLIRSQRSVGSLDSNLFGESVDYYTGQTDFVVTDVSLPGSFALPVRVGRRYHVTNHAGGVLQPVVFRRVRLAVSQVFRCRQTQRRGLDRQLRRTMSNLTCLPQRCDRLAQPMQKFTAPTASSAQHSV